MPTKNIFLSYLYRFNAEIGLKALYESPRDTKYLCLQRFVRFFAYGSSTLILVLYLKRLGIQETKIGLFMTLTLLGDVVISFFLTTIADRIGRRRMLAIGSVLMMMSGIVFATCGNFWVLLIASIFGVISPSGNEIGPFKPIEESAISQLVAYRERSTVLSWYYLFGTLGTAVGSLTCGWTVGELHGKRHWNILNAYRVIFWAYAFMGLLKLGLSLILSEDCEQIKPNGSIPKKPSETTSLLPESDSQVTLIPETKRTLFPKLSDRSRRTVIIFCFLTSLDAIGSGLAPNSWITFYFNKKFHLPEKALGMLFSATSILNAVSNILSSSLVRRIGLVKTMVFTKLPSNISMIFVPFPPSVIGASVLLAIRLCTYDMNVAPRQAFITSAVLPEERTAVLGFLNVLGTLAQAVGPTIAGHLAGIGVFWIAFVLNGGLKSIYDVLLGVCFWNWKSREEEELMKDRDNDGS